MTAVHAWPRLARGKAAANLASFGQRTLHEARLAARLEDPSASTPSWAVPVPTSRVGDVQAQLRAVADAHGWPATLAGPAASAVVDRAWSEVLGEQMAPRAIDAADPGVWRFLALVVVPDLALWRADRSPEPLLDLDDHVFGRLWWRWSVLGASLLDGEGFDPLTDEELRSLFRRRDVVANPTIARAVARAVLRRGPSGPNRLAFTRRLLLQVLRTTPSVCLDVLDDGQLDELLAELARAS